MHFPVLLQVCELKELLIALSTRVGKIIDSVLFEVLLQLALLRVYFIRAVWTDQALGMTGHMQVQLADLDETRWTLIADELLHFVMRFHVIVEVCDLSKRSAAVVFIAYKRPFPGVQATMVIEIGDLQGGEQLISMRIGCNFDYSNDT